MDVIGGAVEVDEDLTLAHLGIPFHEVSADTLRILTDHIHVDRVTALKCTAALETWLGVFLVHSVNFGVWKTPSKARNPVFFASADSTIAKGLQIVFGDQRYNGITCEGLHSTEVAFLLPSQQPRVQILAQIKHFRLRFVLYCLVREQ